MGDSCRCWSIQNNSNNAKYLRNEGAVWDPGATMLFVLLSEKSCKSICWLTCGEVIKETKPNKNSVANKTVFGVVKRLGPLSPASYSHPTRQMIIIPCMLCMLTILWLLCQQLEKGRKASTQALYKSKCFPTLHYHELHNFLNEPIIQITPLEISLNNTWLLPGKRTVPWFVRYLSLGDSVSHQITRDIDWSLLSNKHLLSLFESWNSFVERTSMFSTMPAASVCSDFRFWLTSIPDSGL